MNPANRFIVFLILLMTYGYGSVGAQTELTFSDTPVAGFEAYDCEFVPDTNEVIISASLFGANGLPIPVSDVNLSITILGESAPLISDDIAFATVTDRPPLQMIIVLDTTETMPVEEIIDRMVEELFPRLPVADEVALITFSQEIQPRTAFYTDKNRLVNEHVLDLQILEGDNRLYAAMLDGITSFQLDSDARKVVLVLSDSGRRESDDTLVEDIVARAQLNNVQIFLMGFYTLDFPRANREDFLAIADGGGGYAWFYDQAYISRADVAEQAGIYLNEFVDTLNSEFSITVNMQNLDTGSANFIEFNLTADTANDTRLETTVSCPIERLEHSIIFVDELSDAVVRGRLDVGVVVSSDFPAEDTVIIFTVNGEVAQDTGESIYTIDSTTRTSGYYTIVAQLLDRRGNILATTPTSIRVFSQQNLTLSVNSQESNPAGVNLIVQASQTAEGLTEAEFTIALISAPDEERVVGRAPFDVNNTAQYTINDLNSVTSQLFPELPANTQFIFGGRATGLTINDPFFAVSDEVTITVNELPDSTPIPIEAEAQIAVKPIQITDDMLWILIAILMLIVNILLFTTIRRARIRKLIIIPDDYELSAPLMTITVYINGVSQSHTLTKRTILIGRGSSNDINLGSDSNISRNHGVVMWRNGRWIYTNRKSHLSSIINEHKHRGYLYYRLKPFTEILVGNSLLVFHENSQQDVSELVKTNI